MALTKTAMQIAFDRISDALFVQIDEVGKRAGHTPEFYSLVAEWFGPAVATEYNDWEEREHNAFADMSVEDKPNATEGCDA